MRHSIIPTPEELKQERKGLSRTPPGWGAYKVPEDFDESENYFDTKLGLFIPSTRFKELEL